MSVFVPEAGHGAGHVPVEGVGPGAAALVQPLLRAQLEAALSLGPRLVHQRLGGLGRRGPPRRHRVRMRGPRHRLQHERHVLGCHAHWGGGARSCTGADTRLQILGLNRHVHILKHVLCVGSEVSRSISIFIGQWPSNRNNYADDMLDTRNYKPKDLLPPPDQLYKK